MMTTTTTTEIPADAIYYTGDMCNQHGWFRIIAERGPHAVDLAEIGGEGRTLLGVYRAGIGETYAGHCDPRFVTRAAYLAFRTAQLAQLA